MRGDPACIKKSPLAWGGDFGRWQWARSPIPTPVRTGSGSKDFRAANRPSGFSAPCRGSPWNVTAFNAAAHAGSRARRRNRRSALRPTGAKAYRSFHRDLRAELFPEDWAGDVAAEDDLGERV